MFEKIIETFKKKNIKVIPVETKEDACGKILEIIPEKSSVRYGGSATIDSIGILKKLMTGSYNLHDKKSFQQVDYFLSGSNAITEDGKIINTDRNGNRVSSLIYGPKYVIIVVGKNKIVKDAAAALERIKNIAAPLNAKKLNLNTPCALTGKCTDCSSPDRICCSTVIIEKQYEPNRMTVILVNENLGY